MVCIYVPAPMSLPEYLIVLALFGEKTTLSPLNLLCTFIGATVPECVDFDHLFNTCVKLNY